jgi:hypothetical protein
MLTVSRHQEVFRHSIDSMRKLWVLVLPRYERSAEKSVPKHLLNQFIKVERHSRCHSLPCSPLRCSLLPDWTILHAMLQVLHG